MKKKIGSLYFMLVYGAGTGISAYAAIQITDFQHLPILTLMAVLYVGIFCSFMLQIFVHELGHLCFGLLSGYRFVSIRFISHMWIRKQDGRIHYKRFSLVGTGGQCLLSPPEREQECIPYRLYYLGGVLMNALSCLPFMGILLGSHNPVVKSVCMMAISAGIVSVLINAVPIAELAANDGYSVLQQREPEVRRMILNELKLHVLMAADISLKDMPEALFELPGDEAIKDKPILASQAINVENRMLVQGEWAQAYALTERLLHADFFPELYRNLMLQDRIYLGLMRGDSEEMLKKMFTEKNFQTYCKRMKTSPSVMRTQYSYALLVEKDGQLAESLRQKFLKLASSYPYMGEYEDERTLMERAEKLYHSVSPEIEGT